MRGLRRFGRAGIVLAALGMAGCEANEPNSRFVSTSNTIAGPSPSTPPAREASPKADDAATKAAVAGRKIIYNARIDLVTEDLNKFERELTKLIQSNQAYVADSDRAGQAGSTRHGTWKVRVPVDRYDPFVQGALTLGELVSSKAESQDVSEEFFDLEAREAAKKVEEQRLLKHLTDSTGKLDEILAVERELSRVRSEIERMRGRLRGLENLTTLATVTITASEIKGYVPPEAPTLATRIGRTFAGSVDALRQFGEAVLILVVAVLPWIPLVALVGALTYWIVRRANPPLPAPAPIDGPRPSKRG